MKKIKKLKKISNFQKNNQSYFSRIKNAILKANLEDSSHFYFFFKEDIIANIL